MTDAGEWRAATAFSRPNDGQVVWAMYERPLFGDFVTICLFLDGRYHDLLDKERIVTPDGWQPMAWPGTPAQLAEMRRRGWLKD